MLVTSASTKDVTCAEMRRESIIRSAIILRIRSISIISSPLSVASGTCFFMLLVGVVFCAEEMVMPNFLFSTYSRISFLVMRPSDPVPEIFSSSAPEMFSCRAIFLTKGE